MTEPSNRATLLALADQVEALDATDSHNLRGYLYHDLALALGWHRVPPTQSRFKGGHWIAPEDCRDGDPVMCSLHGTDIHRKPPRWLESIDAAVSLIPEGIEWDVSTIYCVARATVGLNTESPSFGEHKGCLPALAITAAALRAIAEGVE